MVKKIKNKKLKSKQKKAAKKEMKSLQEDLNSLPEVCSFCNSKFDLKKDADTWMVVSFKGIRPSLICPSCFKEKNK